MLHCLILTKTGGKKIMNFLLIHTIKRTLKRTQFFLEAFRPKCNSHLGFFWQLHWISPTNLEAKGVGYPRGFPPLDATLPPRKKRRGPFLFETIHHQWSLNWACLGLKFLEGGGSFSGDIRCITIFQHTPGTQL